MDSFVSRSSVSDITCSRSYVDLFFVFTRVIGWKCSLSEEPSASVVTTGVTDAISESERFTSPSSIGISRNAESSTKRKYGDPYLSLLFA